MNTYTFYWKGGTREVLKGDTPEDAAAKAGYNQGNIPALDFYVDGLDNNYTFNGKWIRTGTQVLDFRVHHQNNGR